MKHTTTTLTAILLGFGLGIGLSPVPSQAATFTPYNPTPHLSEVDLDDIIAAQGPGWVRIPDDLDTTFPVAGYGPLYLVAWEDLPLAISDNDLNDLVLLFDSSSKTFQFIAEYSADTHQWHEAGGVLFLDSGQTCCGTADFSSLSSPDRMLAWGRPQPEAVPEPASAALLGIGLLGLVAVARRRSRG